MIKVTNSQGNKPIYLAPEHIIGVEEADDVTPIDTTVHRVFYFVQESVAEVVRKIQDAKLKGN